MKEMVADELDRARRLAEKPDHTLRIEREREALRLGNHAYPVWTPPMVEAQLAFAARA
jgi:hypothetical protein